MCIHYFLIKRKKLFGWPNTYLANVEISFSSMGNGASYKRIVFYIFHLFSRAERTKSYPLNSTLLKTRQHFLRRNATLHRRLVFSRKIAMITKVPCIGIFIKSSQLPAYISLEDGRSKFSFVRLERGSNTGSSCNFLPCRCVWNISRLDQLLRAFPICRTRLHEHRL